MARKPLLQARVEHTTKDAVDNYADENDLSQSEAVRRLIHHGLADEGYNAAGDRNWLERLASTGTMTIAAVVGLLAVGLSGLAALLADASLAAAVVALVGGFILLVSMAVITTAAALAQLALARPLRGLLPFAKDGETA